MQTILTWDTGKVLHKVDTDSIKSAVELCKSNLSHADLRNLSLVKADLRGGQFELSHLENTDLAQANLRDSVFFGTKLTNTSFKKANLINVVFSGTPMRGANFEGANLRGASFHACSDLRYSNIRPAQLVGAYLNGERLTKSPIFIHGEYFCIVTENNLEVNDRSYSHKYWELVTDNQLKSHYIDCEFWKTYGESLLALCKAHAK